MYLKSFLPFRLTKCIFYKSNLKTYNQREKQNE